MIFKNIQMKIKGLVSLVLVVAALVAACSKNGASGGNSLFGSYDQQGMLTNVGNNVLVPVINNFSSNASACATAITTFTTSPDAGSLTAAQAAWTQLAQSWAAEAPFDFGPVSDNLWYTQIDTWPVKDTKIETAVSAQSDAASQGSDAKGMKALEYLLFDAGGNQAVLDKYTTDPSAANRKKYLLSVVQNLAATASSLQNAWTGNGAYATAFVSATGNDVSSSVSKLVNAISLYLDEVKNMKVGNPIGMGVKVNDNQPHPDMIEYTIAEQSLPAMKTNLQNMKTAFDGGSGQGLDDLLNYLKAQKNGKNLSVVVDSLFDNIGTQINAINPPYATAVGSQTQQLKDMFGSLKLLISYFKVDIANNLGVTITFTDTDGD